MHISHLCLGEDKLLILAVGYDLFRIHVVAFMLTCERNTRNLNALITRSKEVRVELIFGPKTCWSSVKLFMKRQGCKQGTCGLLNMNRLNHTSHVALPGRGLDTGTGMSGHFLLRR